MYEVWQARDTSGEDLGAIFFTMGIRTLHSLLPFDSLLLGLILENEPFFTHKPIQKSSLGCKTFYGFIICFIYTLFVPGLRLPWEFCMASFLNVIYT